MSVYYSFIVSILFAVRSSYQTFTDASHKVGCIQNPSKLLFFLTIENPFIFLLLDSIQMVLLRKTGGDFTFHSSYVTVHTSLFTVIKYVMQTTEIQANGNYSRLSLSRTPRDSLKHIEIPVLRHIRFPELRKKN